MTKIRPQLKLVVGVLALLLLSFSYINMSSETEQTGTLESALMAMEGIGEVTIYMHQSEQKSTLFLEATQSTPVGVLVIAEGATQPSIQHKLRQTVASVLQISPHRIQVEPMEGDSIDP